MRASSECSGRAASSRSRRGTSRAVSLLGVFLDAVAEADRKTSGGPARRAGRLPVLREAEFDTLMLDHSSSSAPTTIGLTRRWRARTGSGRSMPARSEWPARHRAARRDAAADPPGVRRVVGEVPARRRPRGAGGSQARVGPEAFGLTQADRAMRPPGVGGRLGLWICRGPDRLAVSSRWARSARARPRAERGGGRLVGSRGGAGLRSDPVYVADSERERLSVPGGGGCGSHPPEGHRPHPDRGGVAAERRARRGGRRARERRWTRRCRDVAARWS